MNFTAVKICSSEWKIIEVNIQFSDFFQFLQYLLLKQISIRLKNIFLFIFV